MRQLPYDKYWIVFAPPGGYRGSVVVMWPEKTAECFDAVGMHYATFEDLRDWNLAAMARFQFGIATQQCLAIGFCCSSRYDLMEVQRICRMEFPLLREEEESL